MTDDATTSLAAALEEQQFETTRARIAAMDQRDRRRRSVERIVAGMDPATAATYLRAPTFVLPWEADETASADHTVNLVTVDGYGPTWAFRCHHDAEAETWRSEYSATDDCWLLSWWDAVGEELLNISGPVTFPLAVRPSHDWTTDGGTLVPDQDVGQVQVFDQLLSELQAARRRVDELSDDLHLLRSDRAVEMARCPCCNSDAH